MAARKSSLSEKWILGAFSPTTPTPFRAEVECTDDCEHCPLYTGRAHDGSLPKSKDDVAVPGCSKRCNRWGAAPEGNGPGPQLICSSCPCIASRYVDDFRTVDPETNKPADVDPTVLRIRELRRNIGRI